MKKIAVVGTDDRTKYLEKLLEKDGMLAPLESADYIWYSMPFSKKENLEDVIKNNKNVITGKISSEQRKVLDANNIKYVDLLEKEELVLENAKITAESTIIPLVTKTKRRISNEKILVLGYGKIAKHLLKILKMYGCSLKCFARNRKYKNEIEERKIKYVDCESLEKEIEDVTVIINTVPANIISEKMAQKIAEKNILYLELASKPYGIDLNMLTYYDVDFNMLSALPAKVMPKDAALVIKKEIDKLFTTTF